MTSPKDYREFAMDCLRLANRSSNPLHRQTMHDLARMWMRTAMVAEQSVTLMDDEQRASAGSRLQKLLD